MKKLALAIVLTIATFASTGVPASTPEDFVIVGARCTDPDGTVVEGDVCGRVGGSCVCYDE